MPPGGISVGSSARAGARRRSSRYIVMSSEPTGTSRPSMARMRSAMPTGEEHPAGRDPEQDQVVGALGAFEDLVGHAGQRAGDLGTVEARCACRQESWQRTSLRPPSPPHRTDLKDVGRPRPYPTPERPAGDRVAPRGRGAASRHAACPDPASRHAPEPGRARCVGRKHPPNGPSRTGANGGSRSVTSPVTLGATGDRPVGAGSPGGSAHGQRLRPRARRAAARHPPAAGPVPARRRGDAPRAAGRPSSSAPTSAATAP